MNSLIYTASSLGALILPVLALLVSLLVRQKLKAKILICGQSAAALLGLSALAEILCLPDLKTATIEYGYLSLRLEHAGSFLLAGITFISAVVICFSERYLASEKNRIEFMRLLSWISASAALLAVSDNFIVAFACWTSLSLGLCLIMEMQANARDSAVTVLGHHLLSDSALLGAMMIVVGSTANFEFSKLADSLAPLRNYASISGFTVPFSNAALASTLLILSFSIKSALFPFHRWLLATLDAPTPLSALLHAGVVNVSAIMAWRLMPVLHETPYLMLAWGVIAFLSALVGTLSMSAQPDIKRKLVYSTVGQMGFMSLQCASGAVGAALFHLLAHGLFKCHMFLGSGSAVSESLTKEKFGSSCVSRSRKNFSPAVPLLITASGACFIIYALDGSSGLTAVSALITAAALLCTLPSASKIETTSLTLAWLGFLLTALISAQASKYFEHIVQYKPEFTAILMPCCISIFALGALGLRSAGKSKLARSIYVHSVNGFYIDEMVFALTNRFRTRPEADMQ